jgi:dTDP-4-amino-4,6-dideoxygalactose transaminase
MIDRSLHVRWPVIGADDRSAVLGVLERNVLSGPFAPEVRAFEREFAAWAGAKHALATNSGTAALHVALAAAGIGPGDEVLTPAFSFVASAMSILHCGAVPVFVDIEPITFGMDPALVEKAVTSRTKAIMPVHIHGTPCDLTNLMEIARARGLKVIEDAAQAHGAAIGSKKVGTFGAVGCFSLQSSKNLACGEGGVLVTDDDELLDRANRTRMFGEDVKFADEAHYDINRPLDGSRAYDSKTIGWMYRLPEMSAALARSQLRRLDAWNEQARRNASVLSAALAKLPGVTPPAVPAGRTSVWHKYRVRLDATKLGVEAPARTVRDAVLKALVAEGMEAVLWQSQPVPGQTLFRERGYDPSAYPETRKLLDSSLCLFSHSFPIAPQPLPLVQQYAETFARVWSQLPKML